MLLCISFHCPGDGAAARGRIKHRLLAGRRLETEGGEAVRREGFGSLYGKKVDILLEKAQKLHSLLKPKKRKEKAKSMKGKAKEDRE